MVEGGPSKEHMRARAMMHADPQSWHRLAGWLSEVAAAFLAVQTESGAAAVQLFDSWAGSLSKQDYRTFVAPHSKRALDAVSGVPKIHFGVGTGPFLGDMRLGGSVDAVGVDWRMPLDEAAGIVGPDITLQGNIDPAMLQAPWEAMVGAVFSAWFGPVVKTSPGIQVLSRMGGPCGARREEGRAVGAHDAPRFRRLAHRRGGGDRMNPSHRARIAGAGPVVPGCVGSSESCC